MHIEAPTRREIWLALFLLVSLLLISRSRSDLNIPPDVRVSGLLTENSSHVQHHSAPHQRIQWGTGEVPQTKIITHVPGKLSSAVERVYMPNYILN